MILAFVTLQGCPSYQLWDGGTPKAFKKQAASKFSYLGGYSACWVDIVALYRYVAALRQGFQSGLG